ncbi:MAG: HopJ type III effector protein [Colwellia sp.]|nr:HopJ type III effector protein [Colwellia sp.]
MKLSISELLKCVSSESETVDFSDVMQVISSHYTYEKSLFTNGELVNQAGTNEGSCKIFAFAKIQNLSEQATLNCFGQYYRDDVLKKPMGNDHGNIRNFIKNGWSGITFERIVLTAK